jgi:thiamine-phosphate pyrophosphorylase
VLLYYITDRTQFPGNEGERRVRLLEKIAQAASCGVGFVQLREKDLPARELEYLARAAREKIGSSGTRLLINSRTDIALATTADGVHLRSKDLSPAEVRRIWRLAERNTDPIVAVSCHTEAEVAAAKEKGADFVVFGPVFEKKESSEARANGLEQLRVACGQGIPILALGGVTLENARVCVEAGAAGVAGIRLFQEGDLVNAVKALRG